MNVVILSEGKGEGDKIKFMKILVTGSQGYVGSAFVNFVKRNKHQIVIDGIDTGYFQNLNHFSQFASDTFLNNLKFKDLRDLSEQDLMEKGGGGYEAVIHLAAISNDPIGEKFEKVTNEINFISTIEVAKKAKKLGIKKFIFASSASVYGFSEDICFENSKVSPITAYAKSKVEAENQLEKLSNDNFQVTCLRFATACGWSPRVRADIALNNFVISAVISKKVLLTSRGDSYRPFIDVQDMSRSILFALSQERDKYKEFEIYNVGQNSWNFLIIDLAEMVVNLVPNSELIINQSSLSDTRSYRLNFDKYNSATRNFIINSSILETITNLKDHIEFLIEQKPDDYFKKIVRLKWLNHLAAKKFIDQNLRLT